MDLYHLEELNFDTISDTDFEQMEEFRKIMHEHKSPEDPLEPFEIFKRNMKIQLQNPDFIINAFRILNLSRDKMIGLLLYGYFADSSSMYEKNPHLAFVELELIPEFRKKGIARSLMKVVYDGLKGKDKKIIIANTQEEDGLKFIDSLGGKPALDNIENRLDLREVDWSMVNSWIENGKTRNPNTKIEFFKTVPDEYLDHFAEVLTETLNDVPLGELELEPISTPEDIRKDEAQLAKMDRYRNYAITLEPDGEISGLTWLGHNPHRKSILGQGLTAVRKHHRGRGLGKLVKAALLNKIRSEYPDAIFISTFNATSNAPMLHINEKLGFKEHKKMYNLQVTFDKLKEYVSKAKEISANPK